MRTKKNISRRAYELDYQSFDLRSLPSIFIQPMMMQLFISMDYF